MSGVVILGAFENVCEDRVRRGFGFAGRIGKFSCPCPDKGAMDAGTLGEGDPVAIGDAF